MASVLDSMAENMCTTARMQMLDKVINALNDEYNEMRKDADASMDLQKLAKCSGMLDAICIVTKMLTTDLQNATAKIKADREVLDVVA